jgi:hypothetical protein
MRFEESAHASIPIQNPNVGWELIEGADDGVEVGIEVGSKDGTADGSSVGPGGQGRPQTDGQTLLAGSKPLGPLSLCLQAFLKILLFFFLFCVLSHPQFFSFPSPVLMFLR